MKGLNFSESKETSLKAEKQQLEQQRTTLTDASDKYVLHDIAILPCGMRLEGCVSKLNSFDCIYYFYAFHKLTIYGFYHIYSLTLSDSRPSWAG